MLHSARMHLSPDARAVRAEPLGRRAIVAPFDCPSMIVPGSLHAVSQPANHHSDRYESVVVRRDAVVGTSADFLGRAGGGQPSPASVLRQYLRLVRALAAAQGIR